MRIVDDGCPALVTVEPTQELDEGVAPSAGLLEAFLPREAGQARTRAIVLALAGLVGMFFALLGWTGMVRDVDKVWGANPTIWFVVGLVIAIAAAIVDTLLGRKADFTQGETGAASTLVNRLLPWIIVALTLIGLLVVKLTHG